MDYVKQTDSPSPRFRDWACLERQYMHLAELQTGKRLSATDMMEVHERCISSKAIKHTYADDDTAYRSRETADPKSDTFSCWVLRGVWEPGHGDGIAEITLRKLGNTNGHFVEVGREYTPTFQRLHKGNNKPYGLNGRRGEYLIEGRLLPSGGTHFIGREFDSYDPFLQWSLLLQQRWFEFIGG